MVLTITITDSLKIVQIYSSQIINANIFHMNHLRSTTKAPKKHTVNLMTIRQDYPYTDNEILLNI